MPAKIISLNRSSYCYKNRYGKLPYLFFACIEKVEDTAVFCSAEYFASGVESFLFGKVRL